MAAAKQRAAQDRPIPENPPPEDVRTSRAREAIKSLPAGKGDQEIIDSFLTEEDFYPVDRVLSFKKDVLDPVHRPDMLRARDPERMALALDYRRSAVVAFHGDMKPWDVLAHPLVEEYYAMNDEQLHRLQDFKVRQSSQLGGMRILFPDDPIPREMR